MKIITNRSIQLEGEHIEAGQPTEVSKAVAEDAIRRGWAVAAPAKASKETPAKEKEGE